MFTRAKMGVFKPKNFLTSLILHEPTLVKNSLSIPEWKQAMEYELDAFVVNIN